MRTELNAPAITVVIPTAGRLELLVDTLRSIGECSGLELLAEVLVVDNTTSGRIAEQLPARTSKLPYRMQVLWEPLPGLHEGRHCGLRHATTEWVAYLDDDAQVESTWMRGAADVVRSGYQAGTGPIRPAWEIAPAEWLRAAARAPAFPYLSLLDLGHGSFAVRPDWVFGANMMLRRDLVHQLRGFHPDGYPPDLVLYRGDGETGIMRKFATAGHRALYCGEMAVRHVIPGPRTDVASLLRRAYIEGISNSFTELRELHHVEGGSLPPARTSVLQRLWQKAAQPASWSGAFELAIRRSVSKRATPPWLLERLRGEYERGRRDHRARFLSDEEFRSHVLRRDWLA